LLRKMPPPALLVQGDGAPDSFLAMAGPTSSRYARLKGYWRHPRHRRQWLIGAGAVALFFALLLVGLWTRACSNDACPAAASALGRPSEQSSKIYAADGRQIGDFTHGERRTDRTLAEMSQAVPAAFISIEDKRFYQHHGVDWVRFFGTIKNILLRRGTQGFSTITMQLAGNLFPESINRSQRDLFKGVPRKVREIKVARDLERHFSKQQILDMYLNRINLGNGAYGVEAAAQRYFGKTSHDLNVAEAAMLAALPRSPEGYNPRKYRTRAVGRRNLVLDAMAEAGYLTHAEAEAWKAYPLVLSEHSDYKGLAEYFVAYVEQILKPQLGDELYTNGFRIYTTLDLDAQQAASDAVEAQLEKIENNQVAGAGKFAHMTYRAYIDQGLTAKSDQGASPYLQGGALVLEAKTGNILAMVGGRDFDDSKFNRITQAYRQPGSSFKPIVYSTAVAAGMSMQDTARDAPISFDMPDGQPNWEPKNYENRFTDSLLTYQQGLWRSLNSIAARVGKRVGPQAVVEEARKFGISTPIHAVPSIYLGTPDVLPIELIAGYSAFANLGSRTVPNAILRVEDKNGRIIYQRPPVRPIPVLDASVAYTMNQALRGVITNGTANQAVYRAGFTMPAGGKTGTTSDYRDVWFIGFTRDLVAGVWMGFDNPQRITTRAQGGLLAAPAWTQMMTDIYQRRSAPGDWTTSSSDSIVSVEIDKTNGLRANPFCPANVREVRTYVKGTEPKEFCQVHSPFRTGGGTH
jgi:penicillin-binding protein 1A